MATPTSDLPWNAPEVRDDVKKQMLLWLPERTKIKLSWLASRTPLSQQQIAREAVEEAIERELKKMKVAQ